MKRLLQSFVFLFFFLLSLTVYAKDLKVHFIDVGQGDSILVETPDDQTILIDAGIHYKPQDDYNPFIYLKDQGINHLDAIFITHPHDDHYGGFKYLCTKKGAKEFPVKAVYYSVDPGEAYGKFEPCLDSIIKQSEKHDQVSARAPPLKFGEVEFAILAPKNPISTSNLSNKNNDSIVMKMTYKNVSFMFTGDADKEVESGLSGKLKSTVLKVGHHASRTATSSTFLNKVSPEYAVISSNDEDGKGKTYGHPHEPALKALKAKKVKLFRTDLSGSIEMDTDGDKITVNVDTEVPQTSQSLWKPGQKSSN